MPRWPCCRTASATNGDRWSPARRLSDCPQGECTLELTCVYSKTEPPLEIIESVPGTHWLPGDVSVHHIGYWSDGVAGDSARLADLSYVEEANAGRWSYYRHPSGLRLELIDRTLAGPMAALWT
jgi:hypothetical protein